MPPALLPEPEIVVCERAHDQAAVEAGTALVRGSDGWIYRLDDLRGEYVVAPGTVEGLSRFVSAWGAKGTQVSLVLVPPRGVLGRAHVDAADSLATGFDPDAIAAAYHAAVLALRKSGAAVPELLEAAATSGLGEKFVFHRDHHWSPEGAKLAMDMVASELKAAGHWPTFTPISYQNVLDRKRGFGGAIGRTMEKDCGYEPYPNERYSDYNSVAIDPAVTSEALLGDPPPPEVLVAGSSHTNKGMKDTFNVTGWLRAATGTDVLNVGVDGGGFSTGLLNWMDTDVARNPPRS